MDTPILNENLKNIAAKLPRSYGSKQERLEKAKEINQLALMLIALKQS